MAATMANNIKLGQVTGGIRMNIIAAVDRNWAIGYKNRLLVSIPADKKWFRQETMGKVIVMGRRTLESFPGGKVLPGRTNIVLTRQKSFKSTGAVLCGSTEELFEELKKYPDEEIYVIGGGTVYRQLLPYCNVAHITKIDHCYMADTWFPNLDEDPAWEITADSEEQTYFDLEYRFVKYERIRKC